MLELRGMEVISVYTMLSTVHCTVIGLSLGLNGIRNHVFTDIRRNGDFSAKGQL